LRGIDCLAGVLIYVGPESDILGIE
jgi:hypothetical protein